MGLEHRRWWVPRCGRQRCCDLSGNRPGIAPRGPTFPPLSPGSRTGPSERRGEACCAKPAPRLATHDQDAGAKAAGRALCANGRYAAPYTRLLRWNRHGSPSKETGACTATMRHSRTRTGPDAAGSVMFGPRRAPGAQGWPVGHGMDRFARGVPQQRLAEAMRRHPD